MLIRINALKTLLLSATLALVLVFLTSKAMEYVQGAKGNQLSTDASSPAAASTPQATSADGLTRFNATDWNARQPAELDHLVSIWPNDSALRKAATERYAQETSTVAKENLEHLLTAHPLPEIRAQAMEWAQVPDNPTARANGFNILKRLQPQKASYRLIRQAFEQENDPAVLAAVVWALQPVYNVLDPDEVRQVVPRLHELTRHPSANVRTASIQRLAQWDRAQKHIEQDVLRLLPDQDAEVRIAAIGASSIAALTSDAVKQRLFAMLDSHKGDDELRSILLLQLDRFSLTAKEYAKYLAVQHELFGVPE